MNMIDELKAARESQCFMAAEIAKLKADLAKLNRWRAAWALAARWKREDSYRWMREQRKTESELAALRSRNAELVAALRGIGATMRDCGLVRDADRIDRLLARAESATPAKTDQVEQWCAEVEASLTPAKHADTVRLEKRGLVHPDTEFAFAEATREAIDAAMGGAK